ncbi:PAQR family membrane homeostasis protein TrhA [Planobacterium oryzisoli]|uniref:Hemolysin III family protein n=1 Tax=Planobacterium oryzisoli TaxID=2771435 RepID=A0A930YVE3_9FLAO|nr:hemolysin III family protein [Planobacterium oryzisoli]MBF5027048.1 hemolysin III family protein [Planobacterium oryzisoli]
MADSKNLLGTYTPLEERLNIYSHLLGALLSVVATVLLVLKAGEDLSSLMAYIVFGVSMVLLYCASTLYHSARDLKRRFKLKILDHAAIYILIAGTYTPFTVIGLKDHQGLWILLLVWSLALIGVVFKLFFTGKFKLFSTLLYVGMGWIVVFYWPVLSEALSEKARYYLILGGVSYTVGALWYSIKKHPLNHAVFHGFVLLGTFFHFLAIYLYI